MNKQTQKRGVLSLILIFIGLPLFFYATGSFPRRTLLKESISLVTILAYCLMLAQFYVTRSNHLILSGYLQKNIVKIHKIVGYVFISVLLLHPFLIVVPRYFESGIDSMEAFVIILTTFNSFGILIGMCAWLLLFLLGLTSLLRKKLPISYKTWRLLHGILAVLFTVSASWHAINLGRHTTLILSSYLVLVALGGILPLLKIYLSQSLVKEGAGK